MRVSKKHHLSLEKTITLLVCAVVALSLLVTDLLISKKVADNTQKSIEEKAIGIARTVANSPQVIDGLSGKSDVREIQVFSNKITQLYNVQFVVVIDMHKIRKSHPDESKIGKEFVGGDEGPVLEGHEHISIAKGTMGMSLRAFAPVFTSDGKQVGAVAVGILLNVVEQAVEQSRSMTYIGVGFGLLVGILGAVLLGKKIKKVMFGLEPLEIATLLQERSAMLESVREGILAVDPSARITLVNAEGMRLLNRAGISDPIGQDVEECVPNTRLKSVLETGRAELDYEYDLKGITLLSNNVPLYVKGETVGAISTFRDKTEIKQLAEELTGVKIYAEALRAQTHEFMNKLHVILGMVHAKYYDQLVTYVSRIAHQYQTEVGSIVRNIKDPVLAGFFLGKLSYARELGAELTFAQDSFFPEPADPEIVHELITLLGNLVDNAFEAVTESARKTVTVRLFYCEGELLVEVSDTGPGMNKEVKDKMFTKGYSTKAGNRGFGLFLVKRSIQKLNGRIEILSEENHGTAFKVYLPYETGVKIND